MNQMVENPGSGLGVLDGEGTGSPGRAVQVNESPAPHGAPAYVTFGQTAPPTENDAQSDEREQREAEERDADRRMDGRGVQEHQLARSGGVASWHHSVACCGQRGRLPVVQRAPRRMDRRLGGGRPGAQRSRRTASASASGDSDPDLADSDVGLAGVAR